MVNIKSQWYNQCKKGDGFTLWSIPVYVYTCVYELRWQTSVHVKV